MKRVVSTVSQAFDLLTASDRPDDYPVVRLERKGPSSAGDLRAFETSLGWPLPEEYQALLDACGPFDLRFADEGQIELFQLLDAGGAFEIRKGLKAFLTKISATIPEDDALYPVLTLPAEQLLPATMNYDDNGRTSWTFYERDVGTLYYCHEREGLTESSGTLEEYVIEQVLAFARYDLREQRWY